MRRPVAVLATVAAVAVLAGPATAGPAPQLHYFISNDVRQVLMQEAEPSPEDPFVHVRFKRYGGDGQRQVRMGERHKKPGSHQWGRYGFTRPEKLMVGEKVVYTTQASLPCEPAKEPIGVKLEMRYKLPGEPWSGWRAWVSSDYILLPC
jgi:hypothetical protein